MDVLQVVQVLQVLQVDLHNPESLCSRDFVPLCGTQPHNPSTIPEFAEPGKMFCSFEKYALNIQPVTDIGDDCL